MNHFHDLLIQISQQLEFPQPTKSRVLLEISGDLQDLFEYYREEGNNEDRARELAIEKLGLAEPQIADLNNIHQSGLNRWLDRFSRFRIDIWERYILGAMLVLIALLTARQLTTAELFEHANGFIWVVLISVLIGLMIILQRIYFLWIKRDHRPRSLRKGLGSLMGMAIASTAFGVLGTAFDFFITADRIVSDLDAFWYHFWHSWLRVSALGVFSLMATIILALSWFFLLTKVVKIEQAEVAFLLEEN